MTTITTPSTSLLNQPVDRAMVKLAPDSIFDVNLLAALALQEFHIPKTREEVKHWLTYASNDQQTSVIGMLVWMNEESSPVKRSPVPGDLVGFSHQGCEEWFLITPQGYQRLALE